MQNLDVLTDDTDLMVDTDQYLTVVLGSEEYGIPILRVQEIKGFTTITPIPNTPPFVKGVMNLRGTVVPVMDLREKFNLALTDFDKFTVIVVVTVGTRVVGLVVDAVSDVLNIGDAEIVPTPPLGSGVDTSFLTGMAKAAEKLVLLLDIDQTVGAAGIEALAA